MKTVWEKECKRCRHEWIARSAEDPLVCPRCKSYKWKEEKTKTMSVEA